MKKMTRFTMRLQSPTLAIASACLGALLAGLTLNGCTVAEVATEPSKAEAPVRLPSFRLSSRPALEIDSLSEDQLDDTITVSGEIAQKAAVLEGWIYQIKDDTGSLWILSDREVPDVGEVVTVEGTVRYEPIMVDSIDASEFYIEEKAHQRGGDRPVDN